MNSILLVDLPAAYVDGIQASAQPHGVTIVESSHGVASTHIAHALAVMAGSGEDPELVSRIRDVAKATAPTPLVVLALGLGLEQAVHALRAGAVDLIELPLSPQELATKVLERFADFGQTTRSEDLVGNGPLMKRLRERIRSAARVPSTVLLQGETGTGKGLVARQIHRLSERRSGPFVHVDCGALTPSLIESELFGHERGAFTGAAGLRRGRLEVSAGGTLFLDEIGELDLALQRNLLRALEDRLFERVGGTRPIRFSARVVAATNRDLRADVKAGLFRQDLFFRLNVLRLEVPPLRERLNDLAQLVPVALQRVAQSLAVPVPMIAEDFYVHLADHRWPGNVRELFNLIERVLVARPGPVLRGALLDEFLDEPMEGLGPSPDRPSIEDDEAALVQTALIDTGGNVSRAARRLGLARGTLRYRIKKLGLSHLIPRD